jgi:hypothetical protein
MKNFEIVRSIDALKLISPKDLRAWTERAIAPMPQAEVWMPPILVMLVPESVAEVVGSGHTEVIRHSRFPSELPSYYEVWLVGQTGIADYVPALHAIMNDFHGNSAVSEQEMPA